MTPQKALIQTASWVIAALVFDIAIYTILGAAKASEFLNVYVVEKMLSLDNLFVFLLIFSYFKVPDNKRASVLGWGIFGAIVLRAIFIGLGIAVIQKFTFVLYSLGLLLIYSAWEFFSGGDDDNDISKSKIIKFAESLNIPTFIIWIVAIEISDIVFAIDSIPVGLSISQDMLIVYSANIFAIFGLRAFYFVIQSVYGFLPQLRYGISLILAFIGFKILLPLVHINIEPTLSLLIVALILLTNCLVISIKYNHSKSMR